MKALITIMFVSAVLVVVAADNPETKIEGRTLAQFRLAKRAAEINLAITTNAVTSILGKPKVDSGAQWGYSEDDGHQKTTVTIRFAGNGHTVIKVTIQKDLSPAYWLHEPGGQ